MEHFHPDGHGLRGYREAGAVSGAGAHPEGVHTQARPGEVHTAAVTGHSSVPTGGARVGGAPAAGHLVAPGARPGVANTGFVHPGPSAGGFHPGGMTTHASAPAVHASTAGATTKHH